MPITRAKAVALLNKGEMQLYDDSRANAIRGFDAAQLNSRITRARDARNRSRDLVQRQKLASRDRTGNKRGKSGLANQRSKDKVEIMADILKRFEAQLKLAKKSEGKTSSGSAGKARRQPTKAAGRKADRAVARREVARKSAGKTAKKAAAKRTGQATKATAKTAKKAVGKTARKTAGGKSPAAAAKKTVARAGKRTGTRPAKAAATKTAQKPAKAAKKASKASKPKRAERTITPKKALKNTRRLLKAKQEDARQPKAWEAPGQHRGGVSGEGYQTGAAARRAEHLHAAQSRIPAIQGSISTRGRINQGRRDKRGSGSDTE